MNNGKKRDMLNEPLFDNRTDVEWMTTKEVAVHLNTTVRHIQSLRFRREIPCRKVGGKLRFHRPTIDKWMLSTQEGE